MLTRLLAGTGRRLPTFALAGLVLAPALASSAGAARLITGKDIKDDTSRPLT
ncbi:hypothetical protein [Nocardioides taihuensis]|uniref:Uncharacterized protein n=1 Tax=Nocardioides taihuensis TaxID=1835606 RepID=A0ABW0BH01_9ACTN